MNDNWRDTQEAEILASGVPPTDNLESAIVATLPASNTGVGYTAIVVASMERPVLPWSNFTLWRRNTAGAGWLGPSTRRYSDRARTLRLQFPDRHLHHRQHGPESAFLTLSSLGAWLVTTQKKLVLEKHVARLRNCRRCPLIHPPPVSGGAVLSKIILVGQAPGVREPVAGKPFAWTAGKTLFRWFEETSGLTEEMVRAKIYFAAVCRCFPGKAPGGSDRVPNPQEIETAPRGSIARSTFCDRGWSSRSASWRSRNSFPLRNSTR